MALVVKNPLASAGDARDSRSIPESGRSPGIGNDNPFQYSWLDNSTGRGAWRALILHGDAELDTVEHVYLFNQPFSTAFGLPR